MIRSSRTDTPSSLKLLEAQNGSSAVFTVKGDGHVTIANGVNVAGGGATITGTLSVSGAAAIAGLVIPSPHTLSVGGDATITGASTLSGAVTMGSTLNV
jgi:hypothetical protein